MDCTPAASGGAGGGGAGAARRSSDVAAFLAAAAAGDLSTVERHLSAGDVEAHAQEEVNGISALMLASAGGHSAIVEVLLSAGAPWNALDRAGRCAGNHALDAGQQHIVDTLVEHAVRSELLLAASERGAQGESGAINAAYLERNVRYEDDRLLGEREETAVMMEWERCFFSHSHPFSPICHTPILPHMSHRHCFISTQAAHGVTR